MQVILHDFGMDVNAYAALGRNLPGVEPARCPKCARNEGFKGHGARRRKVWLSGMIIVVVIHVLRLRCKACNRISTVLPSFLHPLKRYGFQDIQPVLVGRFLANEGISTGYLQLEKALGRGKKLNSGPAQSTQRSWCQGLEVQAGRWLEAAARWLAGKSGKMVLGPSVTAGGATGLVSLGVQCLDWLHEVAGVPRCSEGEFFSRLWTWGGREFGLPLLAPATRCREGP